MQGVLPEGRVVISGSGLWIPPHSISNEELVASYNAYVDKVNAQNALGADANERESLAYSSVEFVEKASGIKNRYVCDKDGILDVERMRPALPMRADEELSFQAETSVEAAKEALANANVQAKDVDAVIVSCASTERAYPAIAIEVQNELGINGFGFDMLVGCSSATFALHRAYEMVAAGTAKCVLTVNPDMMTPQVDFRDRASHFILGDATTATVVERAEDCTAPDSYEILSVRAKTEFSNNIRSNFGFLSRAHDVDPFTPDKLFHQNGRKVFKNVCPMVAEYLVEHLESLGLTPAQIRRWWLHQANSKMNGLIARKLLGREATHDECPLVLEEYANTASTGSLIAFYLHKEDMASGDLGVICSFGAGYSIGSLLVRKI